MRSEPGTIPSATKETAAALRSSAKPTIGPDASSIIKSSPALPGLPREPARFLLRAIRRHGLGHAAIATAIVVAVACSVLSQYAVRNLVDVLAAHRVDQMWPAFGFIAALVAGDNLAWRIGGFVAARSFVAVAGDIRQDLFNHMLGHSPGFFVERRPGMLAGRITATGTAVFRIESMTTWNVVPPALAVSLAIVMIGTVNPATGLALVAIALLLGAALAWLMRAGRPLHRRYADAAAMTDGALVDVINNVSVVRAFGAVWRERQRFGEDIARECGARRASLDYLERMRTFHAITTALLTAGLLAWTLMRWRAGLATPGDVLLVTTLGFTVLHGTRDLAVAMVEMVQDWARLRDALAALLEPHGMAAPEVGAQPRARRGAVRFSDIGFAYPKASAVLQRFSLTVRPGEKLGLVGRSGSGKSTLLALLQRHYDVASGRVLLDGVDVKAFSPEGLAEMISVVSQDVQLFHRSVLENIRYGRPDATDAEVIRAARAAHAHDFIAALPEGYRTQVGERGSRFSGGQRQRIAIARAVLRDAPILLLDEATSALDSESETAVRDALATLVQGRTVIAVAHRLSTLQHFDRIIVMHDGRIIDEGSPDALAARPGPYREMLRQQRHPRPELVA